MTTKQTAPISSGEGRSAIGDKGELLFASRLPYGWIWQPPRKDLGKDGLIVIRDESELHNFEFSVQIKTTLKPRLSNKALRFSNVSRSSVLYWMAGAYPTLIVAVDLSNDRACYVWHYDLFNSVADVPKTSTGSLTISVPTDNELNTAGWNDIRSEIKRCYNRLYNSMSKGDSFVWVVASTGTICNAAKNLLKISESQVPGENITEDEGITILIEQQQHRNVLTVASRLLSGLSTESKLHRELREWSGLYETMVRQAFPRLGDAPTKIANQFGTEVAFQPDALFSSRRQLIFMVFDLVSLITKIHPSGSHNAA
ncbi:MAG: DUF4365 domain-containing protein [Bacteroidota bacterium]